MTPDTGTRPMRADARRNRDRLVSAAVRAFSDGRPEVTLEAVARDAGVGIGTLYRHFPTREALVEAAYRTELARLCDAAGELLADRPPERALRAWMDRFVAYATAKRGMADALRALVASGGDPFAETRGRLLAAVASLLDAGVRAGTVRDDVEADDVLASLSGVSLAAGDAAQAGRMLDLLAHGLITRPPR
ncbi:TetR/AcrR family transcriptional regulator [Pseudonocardia oceani]|nr:TetR/AcrR family transcriptional regulator [Pseudonocardia oceani]